MPLRLVTTMQRAPNFALKRITKCLTCGKQILSGTDMYSKRFCSVDCKEHYLI